MANRKNVWVEAGSILIFTGGLFTLISLVTYHAADPGIFSTLKGAAQNSCGRMGASVSGKILDFFGLGGFLVPAILFFVAHLFHRKEDWAKITAVFSGLCVALSSLTVFLSLQWKYWAYGDGIILTGGVLGAWVADLLFQVLNFWGAAT
ncbi:MAG: DNA translocase FtsK 4TM domain-containing protein [Bdellovibrio sp.]|nr:DNA translocase FtsK 4TM domain-containing protein [Bdellovibrio sp.]